MTASKRVVVHGHVQGVFFRDGCRQRAEAAAVSGWVSNRGDGTVEAVFEGEDDAVTQMCRWCETGPEHARVERVEISDQEPVGLTDFEVRD